MKQCKTSIIKVIIIFFVIISLTPVASSADEIVTLRSYVEMLISERTKHLETKFTSSEIAVKIAGDNLQRELEKLNELRQEVVKDRSMFITVSLFDSKIDAIHKDVQELKERQTATETRAATWMVAIGIFFVIVQIAINFLIRKKEPIK